MFSVFQKAFLYWFYVSFSLFEGNLSKDEGRSFWVRNVEKLPPTDIVTVRRVCDGPYVAA